MKSKKMKKRKKRRYCSKSLREKRLGQREMRERLSVQQGKQHDENLQYERKGNLWVHGKLGKQSKTSEVIYE